MFQRVLLTKYFPNFVWENKVNKLLKYRKNNEISKRTNLKKLKTLYEKTKTHTKKILKN